MVVVVVVVIVVVVVVAHKAAVGFEVGRLCCSVVGRIVRVETIVSWSATVFVASEKTVEKE